MDAVAERKCRFALVDGGTAGVAVNGRYCNLLVTTGKPFLRRGVSFILPPGSNNSAELRMTTLGLQELGRLKTMDDHFEARGTCSSSDKPELSFQRLRVFFIIAFAACIILFLEMVFDPQKSGDKGSAAASDGRLNEVVVGNREKGSDDAVNSSSDRDRSEDITGDEHRATEDG